MLFPAPDPSSPQRVATSGTRPRRVLTLARIAGDARHLQIVALGSLLLYAALGPEIVSDPERVAVLLLACLGTQALLQGRSGAVDLRSPIITALSLSLLLRVDDLAIAAIAGGLAVGSKFLLRWRGRHFFNPAALAIGVLVLGSDQAWVSPGQWGHAAHAGIAMAGAGLLVLTRAARLDVCAAFLCCWSVILFARALWLGDPMSIPAHQLSNGALLLFAFFMITDPRTTPDHRLGRILFAGCVSAVAAAIVFVGYRADGLILALALCAPLVPFLNAFLPGSHISGRTPHHNVDRSHHVP
jgi:Na+-translocating ferredoxin:NAD+ oxidoreductase RnfD subunit